MSSPSVAVSLSNIGDCTELSLAVRRERGGPFPLPVLVSRLGEWSRAVGALLTQASQYPVNPVRRR